MTLVLAVADDVRSVAGADRLLASGTGLPGIPPECYRTTEPKIWRTASGLILGVCGSQRLAQCLAKDFPGDSPDDLKRWLVADVADLLREIRERETISDTAMLLVVRGPEIYCLRAWDLTLHPAERHAGKRYCAIGAGRHWAYGSLWTSVELGVSLEDAARLALEAASEHSPMVAAPFDFLPTL